MKIYGPIEPGYYWTAYDDGSGLAIREWFRNGPILYGWWEFGTDVLREKDLFTILSERILLPKSVEVEHKLRFL